jgi:hypothetical protein
MMGSWDNGIAPSLKLRRVKNGIMWGMKKMWKNRINIVWLKGDLRIQDHEPLFCAEKEGE